MKKGSMSFLFLFFTKSVSRVIRQTCICIPQVSVWYVQDVHYIFLALVFPVTRYKIVYFLNINYLLYCAGLRKWELDSSSERSELVASGVTLHTFILARKVNTTLGQIAMIIAGRQGLKPGGNDCHLFI